MTLGLSEMQSDHRVGLFAVAGTPPKGAKSAQCEARNQREGQQYPDENEGVYHQVADVVALRGNIFVGGHLSLIANLREQVFGII